MAGLSTEVFKACQHFRELQSSVKRWKEVRQNTIGLITELVPNARKSHQAESKVIMAVSVGIAGLVAASLAGYSNLGVVLIAAAAVTGSYIAIPTLTDKVGSYLYFNKVDVEKAQRALTQDKETSEQMNRLLKESTLTESCDHVSQVSSRYSREQALTIVLECCECTKEEEIQDILDSVQSPTKTIVPRLCVYVVETEKLDMNLVKVVGSLQPDSAEAKLKEITDSLTSDVNKLKELVAVLT